MVRRVSSPNHKVEMTRMIDKRISIIQNYIYIYIYIRSGGDLVSGSCDRGTKPFISNSLLEFYTETIKIVIEIEITNEFILLEIFFGIKRLPLYEYRQWWSLGYTDSKRFQTDRCIGHLDVMYFLVRSVSVWCWYRWCDWVINTEWPIISRLDISLEPVWWFDGKGRMGRGLGGNVQRLGVLSHLTRLRCLIYDTSCKVKN